MTIRLALIALFASAPLLDAQIFPLSQNSWQNPEFVERFLGTYGARTDTEPTVTEEESEVFQQITDLLAVDNIQGAINVLSRSIRAESSAALHMILGNLYLQSGQGGLAIGEYETAIRKFPNFTRAYQNLGRAHVLQGQVKAALPHLIKSVELGGADGQIYGLIGYCYLNDGQMASALNAYNLATVLDPGNRDWKLGRAQTLLSVQRYGEAAALLEELIRERPDERSLWVARADAFINMNQSSQAAAHLEVLRRMGKARRAELSLLADLYLNDGLLKLAAEVYVEALEGSQPLELGRSIAVTKVFLQRDATDRATELLNATRRTHGGSLTAEQRVDLLNVEAQIALREGRDDDAAKLLEQIVEEDPLNGEAQLSLGNYFWDRGEYETAAFHFESAARDRKVKVDALVAFARMRVAQNRFCDAAELLRQSQGTQYRENVAEYLRAVEQACLASGGRRS